MSTAFSSQLIEGGVMVNTTAQSASAGAGTTSAGDKAINNAGSCIVTLAVNDVVKLYVKNNDAVASITITRFNLTLIRID
jgi:hypothetical protein